jgi:hypothetical protein
VSEETLEWLEILARALMWGAVAVLSLAVIGAVSVATSDNALPFFEEFERQNRAIVAIASLGGGIAGAGILAGLGALLRVQIAQYRERGGQ